MRASPRSLAIPWVSFSGSVSKREVCFLVLTLDGVVGVVGLDGVVGVVGFDGVVGLDGVVGWMGWLGWMG